MVSAATELRRKQSRAAGVAYSDEMRFMADRWSNGRVRYMAHANGYVMVRRPRCIPFVLCEKVWRQMPIVSST